jgi:hypothetical protein
MKSYHFHSLLPKAIHLTFLNLCAVICKVRKIIFSQDLQVNFKAVPSR